ncbi:choice-of-anchor D domain-containing protein [Roseivirga misakiensis]|uniref:Dockerin domain-containing protein n=1 Tax=Roseivirga misakiensis TaxID=1563681 RepID=A0A1E5T7A9_9BACT|nr:choice-of-anchor D domain-containing protein [Roseivirga misakiensis]OEK07187.1 hypothetical protein BFP71_05915 [Roseivirga misakiensis]
MTRSIIFRITLLLILSNLGVKSYAQRSASAGSIDPFVDGFSSQVRSTRLSDDKVLIIYSTTVSSATSKIMAVVGTISGSDISYGASVEVTSMIYTRTDVAAFSSSKAIVIFESRLSTDQNRYVLLDINGDAITAGSEQTLGDGDQVSFRMMRATTLTNDKVVVAYEKDTGSGNDKELSIVAGTLNGTTINWGATVRAAFSVSYFDMTRLSDTKFALVYEGNEGTVNLNEGLIRIGELSGTTINLGTEVSFASDEVVDVVQVTALSETEIIVAWEYNVTNDYAGVTYGTISGTTPTFPGNVVTFYTAEGVDDLDVDAISATEFIVAIDGGSGDASPFYTGVVVSNNITLTSPSNIYVGQADDITVSALTSDRVVLAFTNDNAVGTPTVDRGDAMVLTLTATTNPEINVLGNSVDIISGDGSPSVTDHTDFGTGGSLSRTFTIQNQGSGILTLGSSSVTITGTNAADFSVNTQPATSVSGNSSTTFIIDFSSTIASIRTAEIHINSDDIHEPEYIFSIQAVGGSSVPASVTVAATVFLEGAYNGTNLNTAINSSIPAQQPYNGVNSHSQTTSVSIPASAVDWVLVELREASTAATATNATRKGSTAGFLMNDGTIKATDGTSNLTINLTGNTGTDYYVVIYHRNHLPIMSAIAIDGSGGTLTIDFTSNSANTYQTTTALASLTNNKFGMPSGDVNQDGSINSTDLSTWRTNNGAAYSYSGNGSSDFNLDGEINAVDRNDFQQKNTSKTRRVPSN